MSPPTDPCFAQLETRRSFLGKSSTGVGLAALAGLLNQDRALGATIGNYSFPNFTPRAKRVIVLWQGGGPSHIDLFDPKPILTKMAGQDIPNSVRGDTRLSTMSSNYKAWPCVPEIKPYQKYGQCGTEMSTMLPNLGGLADDFCLVRSLHTEAVNHAPGVTFMLTGSQIPGRPSMGAWLTYGLGSESEDLPAYVVMTSSDKEKTCGQLFYDYYWGSGFLPSKHQGVKFNSTGAPVPYLDNPTGMSRQGRRSLLDKLSKLNLEHYAEYGDPEIQTRISQYEMAFRMQTSVPELLDFKKEPEHVIKRYGPDVEVRGTFANNCLTARRLLERGTRFVQLMHSGWDQHSNLFGQLEKQCVDTDAPSAALIQDLKDRDMLKDTLVIWGGEFGRTPFGQYNSGDSKKPTGRDHFGRAFSWIMAGAGIKAGSVYGETDEFGWNITKGAIHVHDIQATILHLCGIDHEKLTFRYQGRQFRLSDVHGHVVKGLFS